jgi:hypothetical protein
MAEAAASAKRTPGRHHLEIHSADVAAVIQDVYAESIFERQHRRYHRKGGDGGRVSPSGHWTSAARFRDRSTWARWPSPCGRNCAG